MIDEDCPGEGKCHGCMDWCDQCGDVDEVCDADRCDAHRCQRCNRVRKDRDAERDISYTCFVCEPTHYPHRWPATLVMLYAFTVVDRNCCATDTLHDIECGIYRLAHGDNDENEFHPRRLARELGFLRGER